MALTAAILLILLALGAQTEREVVKLLPTRAVLPPAAHIAYFYYLSPAPAAPRSHVNPTHGPGALAACTGLLAQGMPQTRRPQMARHRKTLHVQG